jgi:hypothetical protein
MRVVPQRKINQAHSAAISIGCICAQGRPGYYVHPEGQAYSIHQGQLRLLTPRKTGKCWYVDVASSRENLGQLIISHFVENPDRRSHFIHLDRDKSNCRASNLIWVEKSLLFSGNRLTIADIGKIERLHGVASREDVAKWFGVNQSKITQIWIQARKMGRINTVCRQRICA